MDDEEGEGQESFSVSLVVSPNIPLRVDSSRNTSVVNIIDNESKRLVSKSSHANLMCVILRVMAMY